MEKTFSGQLALTAESPAEFVTSGLILSAMSEIKAKSNASGFIRLVPDFTMERALGLLHDYSPVYRATQWGSVEVILRGEGAVIAARLKLGCLNLDVTCSDLKASEMLASLLQRFRPHRFVNQEEEGIWADFSYLGATGISRQTQFLRCPGWTEIRVNYPAPTRSAIDQLLALKAPWKRGRLIIWHGPPGTGKTYAIRAMLQAWKDRFNFVVITDPENFAASPAYYYQVSSRSLQRPGFSGSAADLGDDDDDEPEKEKDAEMGLRKRHLFLLEDSADLIMEENRTSHYDKLGKLLNMTDGLFGQGREDLFMVTFNEDVARIDPAFLRPGRCIAKVEFPKFGPEDALEWLSQRGVADAKVAKEASLAELYARILADGRSPSDIQARNPRIGFGKP